MKYEVQYWPIFTKAGDFVGCCGLRPKDVTLGIYEFGVHLLPKFWYQGLAIEAALVVIEYAKRQGFAKLFAGHHPNNAASKKMLTKLGFVAIGKEFYPPTGLFHPSYELAL
ncbi:MAG: GNAT family N-acetyltransferase [Neisseriaceae bacterium]